MFDYNLLLTGITLLLCIVLFWRSILLRKRLGERSNFLHMQNAKCKEINQLLESNENLHSDGEDFLAALRLAEAQMEPQNPRTHFVPKPKETHPPERYIYAKKMHQSGIQKEEIASSLGMSGNEISQILKLANLCHNVEDKQDLQGSLRAA